ncbi:NTP/NDP exchange transporter [Novipirellula artificiosorum]|uniref:Major Facilitator Superfamily protein n=1 Tax=Novipirellula artificiosorum TaxID=2528016 RepID=A0A5C6DRM2_9BACT|nr:MFS transporter [Novipirellula artificiosorum]TWU38507.1 Major Facilitator Superfamily protein [Novipirellula artificiosorum]
MSRIESREFACVGWAFAWFFFVLLSYFAIRPIRETMGIEGGTQQLPHLFLITFLAMLVTVPIYSLLVIRLPRRWLVRVVYHFFAICLLVFWALLQVKSSLVSVWTARVIFVWVNVFALFATSVFWSVLADLFTSEQAKRLFGLIAAGGTAGAIAGSLFTALLARQFSTSTLLLVPAVLLEVGLVCAWKLELNSAKLHSTKTNTGSVPSPPTIQSASVATSDSPTGGGLWTGIVQVVQSPYLASICLFLFFVQLLGTQLYLQQANIVNQAIESTADRIRLFASLDLGVQLLTLLVQTVLTGAVLRRFGISVALAILPIVYGIGFMVLANTQSLDALVMLVIATRASGYGITVPAREVLFTVVNREQKYKSKNFIDTVVLRGGDAIAAQVFRGLQAIGVSMTALNWYALPVTAIWFVGAWRLGQRQERLATKKNES